MSMFTDAASGPATTVKLPNSQTPFKELTVTIGDTVVIQAQRDFATKEIKRTKSGQISEQWAVDVLGTDGEEGRIYVDKFALKQAIGKAFLEAGIESFHKGDVLTVKFEGTERLPSGFNANKYSAKVDHKGGPAIVEQNKVNEAEEQAQDQVRQAYGQAAPAPANPWVP